MYARACRTDNTAKQPRFAVYALNRRAAEAATIRAYATHLLVGDDQSRALSCGW